jgi:hypothetical protein
MLVVVSVSTPPLTPPLHFLKDNVALIHSERRRGDGMGQGGYIHFAKWIVTANAG